MGHVVFAVFLSLISTDSLASISAANGINTHKQAPIISLPDMNGNTRTIDYSAAATTIVHFWASWCGPCKEELPQFMEFSGSKAAHNLQLIAIAADNPERARKFLAEVPENITTLVDQYGSSVYRFGVNVVPETHVIDSNGKLLFSIQGPVNWMEKDILKTLNSMK